MAGTSSAARRALTDRIVEFEPGEGCHAAGRKRDSSSRSTGSCSSCSMGATRVTDDADLALKGLLRIADPLLGTCLFDRVGDRALGRPARDARESLEPGRLPRARRDGASTAILTNCSTTCTPSTPSSVARVSTRGSRRSSTSWLPWLVDLEERRADIAVGTSSRSCPPRIRRPAGSSTAAWHAAWGPDAARAWTITVLHRRSRRPCAELGTARHRHDRRPARRALGLHPRPRDLRRLRSTRRPCGSTAALERSSDDA